MSEQEVIGIDIGTSRCRAVLFNVNGDVLAESSHRYPVLTPRPGWQEHDPKTVLEAFLKSLSEILRKTNPERLAGIGISGYYNSIMAVDQRGRPLTNCLLWMDTRSIEEVKALAKQKVMYLNTGCPPHPMYPLFKIKWMERHGHNVFQRAHKFISMKEYIIHELFGEYIVDFSIASATGLFNIHSMQWDDEALQMVGLKPAHLSTIQSPLFVLPPMRSYYANKLRLPRELPIVLGAGDGVLSNIGVGAISPHEVDNTLGTGGAVRAIVPEPLLDEKMRTWCYVVMPGRWAVGGVTAGGLMCDWFIREFIIAEEDMQNNGQRAEHYALLDRYAESVRPGSEGLVFLPFLTGARTPTWDSEARAVLFGLRFHHTIRHVVRSMLEGVVFERYSAFRAVEEVLGGIETVRVSGGFVRSPTWVQIAADVYGRPLLIPSVTETTALGAAFLTMISIGLANDLEDVRSIIKIAKVVYPDPQAHSTYQKLFKIYERLYQKLRDEFATLREFQNGG